MPSGFPAAGVATAIGSLPHSDAGAAASLVLRCIPELPAAPQLPARSAREGVVVQWAEALPEVRVGDDGGLVLRPGDHAEAPIRPVFDPRAHGGLLAFLEAAARLPVAPARVKVQVAGPLTLGVALHRLGVPAPRAFLRGAFASEAWVAAVPALVAARLPGTEVHLWLDEPALVLWSREDPPLEREGAIDLLSSVLAKVRGPNGVHVCGGGDLDLALQAGPDVLGLDAGTVRLSDGIALARYLEGGGWIAWGAVPTDRPVGESPTPLWKALTDLWCELTRRGCDPVRIREQAMVTPACGLAGHGVSQAERALRLARELGARVREQAAATKLSIGA